MLGQNSFRSQALDKMDQNSRSAVCKWLARHVLDSLYFAALLCMLNIVSYCVFQLYFGQHSHIPGPAIAKITRFYIAWFDHWLERNQKLTRLHMEYGSVLCYAPGCISISDPIVMRGVYGAAAKADKSDFFDCFAIFGERPSFSIKSHAEHRTKRALFAGFYNKASVYGPESESWIRENAIKVIDQIENSINMLSNERLATDAPPAIRIDAYPLFNYFALDTITRFMLGTEHATDTLQAGCYEREIVGGIKQADMWGPLKFNFPVIANIASKLLSTLPFRMANILLPQTLQVCLKSEQELADWSWRTTQAAIAEPRTDISHTLLGRLLAHQDILEEVTSEYICAEIFDHTLAGEESVAVVLVYFVYRLAWNPKWQRIVRIALEILPVGEDGFPKFTYIDSEANLEAVFKEVLRVNALSSGRNERLVKAGGQVLGGVYVPERTRVCVSTNSMHNNLNIFPEPELFLPERWLGIETDEMRRMESAYIPFGYGPRACVGKNLCTIEVKILMAYLLLRYEFEAVEEMGDGKTGPLWQSGSMQSVPIGLRCDIIFRAIKSGV